MTLASLVAHVRLTYAYINASYADKKGDIWMKNGSPLFSMRFISLSTFVLASIFGSMSETNAQSYHCETAIGATQAFKSATWCATSFLAPQGGNRYGPGNLARDGAWCEGVRGHGIGERVFFQIEQFNADDTPLAFDRLIISNGYDKSARTFRANARLKDIIITADTGFRMQTRLADIWGERVIMLGEAVAAKTLSVEIRSVYPGEAYQDSCLSLLTPDYGM
jgi:hypothetical protein